MMRTCPAEPEDHDDHRELSLSDAEALRKEVYLGLQICRANSLSLTRLQLALQNGDRPGVLEAVDRLHELDARISRLVQSLPVSANDDPEVRAICRHVDEQSMAVAFEKLALVSEVSGPRMVTPYQAWSAPDLSSEGHPDQTAEPIATRSIPYRQALSFLLALLTFAALAFAAASTLTG